MPQKEKTPDALELLCGKSGRVIGQKAGLMVSLPSIYDSDLQESFEPMLYGTKTVADSIQIATGVLSAMIISPERMKAALSPGMLATDLAGSLVRKDVPFRDTHHLLGQVVTLAERERKPTDRLSKEQLQAIDKRIGEDVTGCSDNKKSPQTRIVKGGTSRKSVEGRIKLLVTMLQ